MKKFIALLVLAVAPLMAQHATQFAYFHVEDSTQGPIAPPNISALPPNVFEAVDFDAQFFSTEGFSYVDDSTSEIVIKHAGWYQVSFLLTATVSVCGSGDNIQFAVLYKSDVNSTNSFIIPNSVFAVPTTVDGAEQLAGQFVFFADAGSTIQLVNNGISPVTLENLPGIPSPPQPFNVEASLFICEMLGR